jgi:hypothetical protein
MSYAVQTEQKVQWQQSGPWWYLQSERVNAYLWPDSDGRWVSDTPPVVGRWNTAEDAKAAVVAAYRKQAQELLASLPD